MSVVGSVNGEDGVIYEMERGEADEDNESLPQECVSLEDECEVPPHGFHVGVGIEGRYDLGLPSCIRKVLPKTGLTVCEYGIVGYHLGVYSLILLNRILP